MKKLALALAVMALAQPLQAADHDHMMHHAAPPDARAPVFFPAPMKAQQLANMRDHLESLDRILAALAANDTAKAAEVAATHLGMDSPSAEGCKPNPAGGSMDAMMEQFMPPEMRTLGLAMHGAASDFAAKPSVAALSKVTQHCVACHSAYKLQ